MAAEEGELVAGGAAAPVPVPLEGLDETLELALEVGCEPGAEELPEADAGAELGAVMEGVTDGAAADDPGDPGDPPAAVVEIKGEDVAPFAELDATTVPPSDATALQLEVAGAGWASGVTGSPWWKVEVP